MTSYTQVKDFITTSDADANKNMSSETYNFTVPITSVVVGSYALKQFTIPLNKQTRFYQLYLNYSLTPDDWYSFPVADLVYNSDPANSLQIATNVTQSGGNLVINTYLINSGTGDLLIASFDVSITRRDFVDSA